MPRETIASLKEQNVDLKIAAAQKDQKIDNLEQNLEWLDRSLDSARAEISSLRLRLADAARLIATLGTLVDSSRPMMGIEHKA